MTRRVITSTLCDVCLEVDGVEVEAEEWRFGVEAPGERWRWLSVDLCPIHTSGPVSDMVDLVTKYGRTDKATKAPKATASTDLITLTESGAFECPDCNKTFATSQGVGAHRARSHGFRR